MLNGLNLSIAFSVILKLENNFLSILIRVIIITLCLLLLYKLDFSNKIEKLLVLLFWIIYGFRLFNDLYILEIYKLSDFYSSPTKISSYAFGGILIPVLAILYGNFSIKKINFSKWLKISLDITAAITLIGLFSIYHDNILNLFFNRYLLQNPDYIQGLTSTFNGISLSRLGSIILINHAVSSYKRANLIELASITIGFMLLIVGGSRGPLIITFMIYTFILIKNRKYILVLILSTLAAVFLTSLSYISDLSVVNRLSNTENNRIGHWEAAIDSFLNNPIIGDQILDRHLYQYPHNIILEAFMSTGFLGGLLILLIIASSLKTTSFQHSHGKKEIYYLFLQFLGFAMVSGALFNSVEFWICSAILIKLKHDE